MSDTQVFTGTPLVAQPCPASIWLLGAAAHCTKNLGHDGFHEVKILWDVQ